MRYKQRDIELAMNVLYNEMRVTEDSALRVALQIACCTMNHYLEDQKQMEDDGK